MNKVRESVYTKRSVKKSAIIDAFVSCSTRSQDVKRKHTRERGGLHTAKVQVDNNRSAKEEAIIDAFVSCLSRLLDTNRKYERDLGGLNECWFARV